MTFLDFFAELCAEANGTTVEHERNNLIAHTTNDHHHLLDHEVSAAMIAQGRALIKSDPDGFRRQMASGTFRWLAKTTKH